MSKAEWKQDPEYMSYVGELLKEPAVKKLNEYEQHHATTRLEHCLTVSYTSYLIAKKMHLNAKATARAGLLHDLFYYDWRTTKFDNGTHAWIHPRIAVRNAERITDLTPLERDIIVKHMWGATICPPKYPEGYIVTAVDKYSAISEYSGHLATKMEHILKQRLSFAKVSK